ncbi:MAG: T9SS type A sorting domain-containing protein [Bacteroidetes bacterium]|nr:T9SS type A sorting domain-containing protein [Bacteroidota bacterium]
MKKLIFFLSILFISKSIQAQEWTWMKGTDTLTKPGIYGTMGVASPSNNPGARHGAATWVDNNGDLWLFGGEGVTTNTVLCWLNDLWIYTISTGNWTWMGGTNLPNQNGIYGTLGVPSTTNMPGAREFMMYWTDASGNFWMFGGEGFPAAGGIGGLNDLWRYNPTTNEWTWMHGTNIIDDPSNYGTKNVFSSTNTPGARHGSGKCIDGSGNLWLFGGYGLASTTINGNCNDLWKYNIATNQWAWVSGTNVINQYGNYGTKGIASISNNPGGREFPACWFENNGNIWLYGGGGFPASGTQGYLNDLWKYNISTDTWTWKQGTNLVNQQGNYGTKNSFSPTTAPGGRFGAADWVDNTGNLWLFGGTGYANSVVPGRLNDMFRYNIFTDEWSWEHGMNSTNANGIYGAMTIPAPFTTPGARYYNTWWKPTNGYFWLFGGLGFSAVSASQNNMNDLWRFGPPCTPVLLNASNSLSLCSGNSITLTAASTTTGTINWYSSTSTVAVASGSAFATPVFTVSGASTTETFYIENSSCTGQTPITLTINPTPTVSIFTDNPLICAGSTVSLTANGAFTYAWNTSATGSVIAISPSVTTTYTVTGTDTSGCTNTAVLTQSVSACTGIASIKDTEWNQAIYPNPNNGGFNVSSTFEEAEFVLYNLLGQMVHKEKINRGENRIKTEITKGVYLYSIEQKNKIVKQGKMVIE